MTHLNPNPDWGVLPLFDRTGWTRMAFGAFAESIGERAEPKHAHEDIYVGWSIWTRSDCTFGAGGRSAKSRARSFGSRRATSSLADSMYR